MDGATTETGTATRVETTARRARSAESGEAAGGLELGKLINMVWRGKWVVLLCAVFAGAAAFVMVKQQTPIYSATTLLLIQGDQQNVVSVQQVVSGVDTSSVGLQTESEIIRSDQLADRVIGQLRLDLDPEFNPALGGGERGLFGRLVASVSEDLARLFFGPPPPPPPAPSEDGVVPPYDPTNGALVRLLFKNAVRVQMRPLSRALAIVVSSTDPAKAALIANTIADQYIVDRLQARFEGTQRATIWLNERLADLRENVRAAERSVEEYRATLTEQAGSTIELTEAQLSQLNTNLIEARARTAEAEVRYQQVLALSRRGTDITAAAEVQASSTIQGLRTKLADLGRRQAELATRYGPRHPTMVNLRAEIEDTRREIRSELEQIVQTLRSELAVARAREESLQAQVDGLQGTSLEQSQGALRLRELQREAEAAALIYQNFLNRFNETSAQQTAEEREARVISQAIRPSIPSSPNVRRSVMLGLGLGAVIGFGIIFLLERLNNTFRSRSDVETRLGIPVLATTPSLGARRRRSDMLSYVEDRPNSALSEAIRNVRTSILLSNIDSPPRVVLVTSSIPSEGKSTLALLLASTSARMGKKAVLVDCDMRRPTVADAFPVAPAGDLVGVLTGEVALRDAIVGDIETDNLCALPSLVAKGNPADLINSQRFRKLMDTLSDHFDMVVIDSPPVSLVTDARILATIADATILAVRWDETPTDLVVESLQQLEDVGANVVGATLTMVDERRQASYSYGYRGRYGRYYAGDRSYYVN